MLGEQLLGLCLVAYFHCTWIAETGKDRLGDPGSLPRCLPHGWQALRDRALRCHIPHAHEQKAGPEAVPDGMLETQDALYYLVLWKQSAVSEIFTLIPLWALAPQLPTAVTFPELAYIKYIWKGKAVDFCHDQFLLIFNITIASPLDNEKFSILKNLNSFYFPFVKEFISVQLGTTIWFLQKLGIIFRVFPRICLLLGCGWNLQQIILFLQL